MLNNIVRLLTFKFLLVSNHRKRQFVLTVLLLITLSVFKRSEIFSLIPFIYLKQLFFVVFYTLLTNLIFNFFRILIVSAHRKRRNIGSEERDNFTVGLNAMVNIGTSLSVIILTFLAFEIALSAFLSSIALFAVALAIIFQDFIKNFLFGFAIMFRADYEIGHYVQIGTLPKGVIRNITFSNLELQTESGDVLFVPNAVVHANHVVNFSTLKPKRINAEFHVLRTQIQSIDNFTKSLLSHLDTSYPSTFEVEKCRVYVKENTKDEIIFALEAPTKKASLKLREQINHTVQQFAVEYHG